MNKNNEQNEPWVGGLIGAVVGLPIALYGAAFAAIHEGKDFMATADEISDQFVELGEHIDRKYGKDIKSAVVQAAVNWILKGTIDGGGSPPSDSGN